MTDFQNDMYRRYLASGQAQTEAEVREAVELHVYCDMCLSDIQSTCR